MGNMPENITLECPFCGKETINATFIPSMLQAHVSRSACGKNTRFYQSKEKYEIQSGCSNCNKSKKEIEKALKEGKPDTDKEKKILERLKEQGFSSEITSKF
jgi:ribosomal protein S27AE